MPVGIAGMHRSGTSMVTQLLHECGLYLGPESDLHPAGPANPEGHWEHKHLVKVNGRILKQLGGGWDYPPPMPVDWAADRLVPLRDEARSLLAQFADREPWGWKDPRNCLTFPFWQAILGSFRVVVVVRNPLEVAESLRQRNGFSLALGLALWHTYYERLLAAVTVPYRIVTHYDMYFRDPGLELRRLVKFLDLPVDEEVIGRASSARKADLRHHRLTSRDFWGADVNAAVQDLYLKLCSDANWQDEKPAGSSPARLDDPFAVEAVHLQDESDPPGLTRRPDRRPVKTVGHVRPRQQLEEARARIAELEQTVLVQQRELTTLRQRADD